MLLLAVDSCTNVATCSLLHDGKVVGEMTINNKKTHSTKLLPLIENILSASEYTLNDIDYYVVTVGVGSFTGQRIGISTVKGLSFGDGNCCIGVSSLECLAYNLPFFDGIICPIIDARRELVYNALFRWENGVLKRLCDDRAIELSELQQQLDGENVMFLGDGVEVYSDKINFSIAPKHLLHLKGSSVGVCGMEHIDSATDSINLLPIYLRGGMV